MLRTLTDRMRQQAAAETARLTHLADEERRRAIDIAQAYDDLVSETSKLQPEIESLDAKIADEFSQRESLINALSDLKREIDFQTDRANREEKRANSAEGQIAEERRKSAEAQGRASILEQDRERLAALESQLSSFVSILQKGNPQ
jgi:chromosome segregation ATPase